MLSPWERRIYGAMIGAGVGAYAKAGAGFHQRTLGGTSRSRDVES